MEKQTYLQKHTSKEPNKTTDNIIYFASKQRYGSPRITIELNASGCKKFKVATDSEHNYLVVENVLDRNFIVAHPSKVWASDITYIQTKEGFYA